MSRFALAARLIAIAALLAISVALLSPAARERARRWISASSDAASYVHQQRRSAGEANIALRLDRTRAIVADRIEMTLIVEADADAWIDWPDMAGALGDRLRPVGDPAVETRVASGGGLIETRRFTIEPFLPGEIEIPSLTFRIGRGAAGAAANDRTITIATEPVMLRVRSVLENAESPTLAPAKGVVDPPPRTALRFGLAAAAASAIAAMLLAMAALARRRAKLAGSQRPAHEQALADLRRLQETHSLDEEQRELFMERLAVVLRRYIDARFGLGATRRTTDELLREARRRRAMRADDINEVSALLRACDLVKFAGDRPAAEQVKDAARRAVEFIERTVANERRRKPTPSDAAEPPT